MSRILPGLFLLTFFSVNNVLASKPLVVDAKTIQQLSQQTEWLKLLHMRRHLFTGEYESYVDGVEFFLAATGKFDPVAELQATLVMLAQQDSVDDKSVVCRFPARVAWIIKQLPEISWPKEADCAEYAKWRIEINTESIQLIFASAFLNSPSSMFGHTLFRLDPLQQNSPSDWLSYALNFGAMVDQSDNSLLYSFRGIAGGYYGKFQLLRYFKKIQEYSFMESRDIWEYRLNLNKDELERFLQHLWELRDINFDYYFVSENCSFRLLELLEVARPGSELIDKYSVTVIPSEIIDTLHQQGFIESRYFRPSLLTKLKNQVAEISKLQKYWVQQLAEDPGYAKHDDFRGLDPQQQWQIIDSAYRLMRYRVRSQPRSEHLAKQQFRLLKLLNSHAFTGKLAVKHYEPSAPEAGHRSRMAAMSIGHLQDKTYWELNYRQNYHDLLDNPDGYFKGAAINFMNIKLRAYEDNRYRLQQLEVLDITSLTPRDHFFQPISWRVSAGLSYQNYEKDKLSVYLNGGAGLTYSWLDSSYSYGLLNLHLEHNQNFAYLLQPGAGLKLGHLHYTKFGNSQLEFDSKFFIDGSYRNQLGISHQFVLARNHGLRVGYDHHWNKGGDDNQMQISYRFYF